MAASHRESIAVLRGSHDRLVSLVEALGPDGVTAPSYCSEWSIAQVLSHLGSGAEIGRLMLEAVVAGAPMPERERYVAIWDRWNALSPQEMAAHAIRSDRQQVMTLESLDDATLDLMRIPWFGGQELDAAGLVAMRLFEHTLHLWDIEVMGDATATLRAPSVDVLVERIETRLPRLASGPKPSGLPIALAVLGTDPEHSTRIEIDADAVRVGGEPEAENTLAIPTEAFIRLTFGRMDPEHTPEEATINGTLSIETLRALFPGN